MEEGGEEEERSVDEELEFAEDAEESPDTVVKDPLFDETTAGPPAVEPHFGTEFWEASAEELRTLMATVSSDPSPSSLAAKAKTCFHLPEPNLFIATNFAVCSAPAGSDASSPVLDAATPDKLRSLYASFPVLPSTMPGHPKCLSNAAPCIAVAKIWHHQDIVFCTPKSEVWLKLSTADANVMDTGSATVKVLMEWLCRSLNDALNETCYMAEQANLYLNVFATEYGLDLRAGGFHHKLPLLLQAGFRELLSFGDSDAWNGRLSSEAFLARLSSQKENLLRDYRNAYLRPGEHVADLRRLLIMPDMKAAPDCARALQAVDAQALATFAQGLIPMLKVEVLIMGNHTAEDAIQIVNESIASCLQTFARCRKTTSEETALHPPMHTAILPNDAVTLWVQEGHDAGNRNVAVEFYWQLEPTKEARPRAILDLLDSLLAESLFDSLRTKQQLGYEVGNMARVSHMVLGFSIWLLSSKASPSTICHRVEALLPELREKVRSMPPEDFENYVVSLAATKLEPPLSLDVVQGMAWEELQKRQYVFDRNLQEAIALASITREDVLELMDRSILPGATCRRLAICTVIGKKARASQLSGPSLPISAEMELHEFQQTYPGAHVVTSQAEFLASVPQHESFV
jgi:secreted Zn-dependent insulinase-like peptidase